jgi:multiple sugar transport system substrate-binding protein
MKILKYFVVISTFFLSTISYAGTLVINSNQSDPRANEVMHAYIKAFDEAHPDITVVVNDFDTEEYKVSIRNFLQADPPDVAIWFAGNRMKFFVDQGLFEDVSDVWESAGFNDSMSATKGALTVDGKQYGVPYGYYQWGVYYRKDIFDDLGLNEPRTWDEFKWVCAMLKKNGVTPISIGTRYLWTAAGWFDYMNMRVNGYDFHMDLMNGDASYEDPRLDDVFDKWAELLNAGYFLEDHAALSWQEAITPMINGEAAMYLMGNFMVPFFEDAGMVDKVDYFQFPKIYEGIGMAEDAPTDTFHIPSGAKNKEDARKFLAFLANPEEAYKLASGNGVLTPNGNAKAPEDRFQKQGFKVLSNASDIAQFYDRDTHPDMHADGMPGLQEFMVKPDRIGAIRSRLDKTRKRVFSSN